MAGGILAYCENRNGKFRKVAYEIASEARRLGDRLGRDVTLMIFGDNVFESARHLSDFNPTRILVAESPIFQQYSGEGYAAVCEAIARQEAPSLILFPASVEGKDLAPRLAARLEAGLATDCVALEVQDGKFFFKRPVFAGKTMLTVEVKTKPAIASLRPNVFPIEKRSVPKPIEPQRVAVDIRPEHLAATVKKFVPSAGGKIELTEADIVISGGRGMQAAENFKLIEELAAVWGAAVGASRAAVDAGWRPHEDQVGQTGKTVSPKLYVACGISGAIQHLAGMSSSKIIVAINKDADAPIFKVATYGIVGDLFEVVPALTAEIRKLVQERGS